MTENLKINKEKVKEATETYLVAQRAEQLKLKIEEERKKEIAKTKATTKENQVRQQIEQLKEILTEIMTDKDVKSLLKATNQSIRLAVWKDDDYYTYIRTVWPYIELYAFGLGHTVDPFDGPEHVNTKSYLHNLCVRLAKHGFDKDCIKEAYVNGVNQIIENHSKWLCCTNNLSL